MTLSLITDYDTLKAAIAAWLKRDDLTDSIPLFIQAYEQQLNRELMLMEPPHRALENSQTDTLDSATLALPTGYLGTKRLKLTTSGNVHILKYKAPSQMVYDGTDVPYFYTVIDGALEIGAAPDGSYSYEWVYFAPISSVASGSNWIIENAPDLYLYGALLHSAPYLKNDARLVTWANLYSNALAQVEQTNTKAIQSGSPLQIRADVNFN